MFFGAIVDDARIPTSKDHNSSPRAFDSGELKDNTDMKSLTSLFAIRQCFRFAPKQSLTPLFAIRHVFRFSAGLLDIYAYMLIFWSRLLPYLKYTKSECSEKHRLVGAIAIHPCDKNQKSHELALLYISGLCGNVLTLMVTTSRAYRNTAHGLYITAMAVADITFLLTQPLNRAFVHDLFGWDIRTYSIFGCKVYFFFLRWARPMSALVIVLVCIERFVAIWFPLKAKLFSSRRTALIEVCSIFCLASFVSGFRTQTVGIQNNVCLAVVVTSYNKHLKALCSIMGMTIRTLIPTSTLLILTPPTVTKLFYQRRLRREMSQGKANKSDETFRVSLMLLSVAIAFCVLVTPFCLSKHGYLLTGTNIVSTSTPWMKGLNEIRLICEQVNCVINFLLYVLISRKFRNQFYKILTCQTGRGLQRGTSYKSSDKGSIKTLPSMISNGSLKK